MQVHCARALAVPLVNALASPVMARRPSGMAATLPAGLPRKVSETEDGVSTRPTFPSAGSCPLPLLGPSPPLRRRSTGQKYADLSPPAQVVPAARSEPSVEKASVERLPT